MRLHGLLQDNKPMAISIKLKQSSLRLFFTYTLGIAAIVYVFHHTDFSTLDLNTIFQPKILALLMTTRLLGYLLVSLRWKMILQEFSISVPLQQVFRLNMITLSLSYFIPGSVTADLGKGMLLGRQNSGEYKKILLSIFLDRLVGFFAILILFAVGFAWAWQEDARRILLISESINWKLLGLLSVAFAAIFVFLFSKPNRFLKFKKMNLNLQMINRTFWLKTLALSFMAHLTFIFFMPIGRGSGVKLHFVGLVQASVVASTKAGKKTKTMGFKTVGHHRLDRKHRCVGKSGVGALLMEGLDGPKVLTNR